MFSQMGFTAHEETWSLFFFPICWGFFTFEIICLINKAFSCILHTNHFPLLPFLQSPRLSHLPPSPTSHPPSPFRKGKASHGIEQRALSWLFQSFFSFPDWISWGALTSHVLSEWYCALYKPRKQQNRVARHQRLQSYMTKLVFPLQIVLVHIVIVWESWFMIICTSLDVPQWFLILLSFNL